MPLDLDTGPIGGELDADVLVIGAHWDAFAEWFTAIWEHGHHVALIGPTRQGKTNLLIELGRLRPYAVILDSKGMDRTLQESGYRRIGAWPPPSDVWDDIADGLPAHLLIGGPVRSDQEWDRLASVISDALTGVFQAHGSWTVGVDELQITSQMMGLKRKIERNLIAAADRGVTMITGYQAPSWVPTAASRQARWLFLYPTRDEDVIKNVAAKAGRPWRDLKEALHVLPDYHVLVAGTNPRVPLVITHAPKQTPRRTRNDT